MRKCVMALSDAVLALGTSPRKKGAREEPA